MIRLKIWYTTKTTSSSDNIIRRMLIKRRQNRTRSKSSPRLRTLRPNMTRLFKLLRLPNPNQLMKKMTAFSLWWPKRKKSKKVRKMNSLLHSSPVLIPKRKFTSPPKKNFKNFLTKWSLSIFKYWKTKTQPYTRKRWIVITNYYRNNKNQSKNV